MLCKSGIVRLRYNLDWFLVPAMKIQIAYQFELKVRSRQEQKHRRAAGCCRFAWYKALRAGASGYSDRSGELR